MKPRTKLQFRIVDLSKSLEQLSNKHERWAKKNCLLHLAFASSKTFHCMDCGHSWKRDSKRKRNTVCPHCDTKLRVENTRKRTLQQHSYFYVFSVVEDMQVCRLCEIDALSKAGRPTDLSVRELCQIWITPKGKYEIYSLLHRQNTYMDTWCGEFAFREKEEKIRYWRKYLYKVESDMFYPEKELTPELEKKGFNFVDLGVKVSPLELALALFFDNRAESLIKMRQGSLLSLYLKEKGRIDRYWRSICICQRRKYIVKDAILWVDYLSSLEFLQKDLRNPFYICPKDLKKSHDSFLRKKQRKEAELRALQREIQIKEEEEEYKEKKGGFLGFTLKVDELEIKTLDSVREVFEEGKKLNHCVFSNNYYKREDSVLLSARINGEPIETIEICTKSWRILQCRGKNNNITPFHDKILNVMKKNIRALAEKAAS